MFFLRPTAATGAEKLPKTCLMLTLYIQSQCSGWTEFFKSIKSSQTERQPQPHWLDIILWLDLITFRVLYPARWLYIMIWLWLYGWTKWLYLRPAEIWPVLNTTTSSNHTAKTKSLDPAKVLCTASECGCSFFSVWLDLILWMLQSSHCDWTDQTGIWPSPGSSSSC